MALKRANVVFFFEEEEEEDHEEVVAAGVAGVDGPGVCRLSSVEVAGGTSEDEDLAAAAAAAVSEALDWITGTRSCGTSIGEGGGR